MIRLEPTLAAMLENSVRAFRYNHRIMLAHAARIVAVALLVIAVGALIAMALPEVSYGVAALVFLIVALFTTWVSHAMCCLVAFQAIDDAQEMKPCLDLVRGRLGAAFWLVTVNILISLMVSMGFAVIGAGFEGQQQMSMLWQLISMFVGAIVATMLLTSVPAFHVERLGVLDALSRGAELAKTRFWMVFGFQLLVQVMMGIAVGLLAIPVLLIGFALGGSPISFMIPGMLIGLPALTVIICVWPVMMAVAWATLVQNTDQP